MYIIVVVRAVLQEFVYNVLASTIAYRGRTWRVTWHQNLTLQDTKDLKIPEINPLQSKGDKL